MNREILRLAVPTIISNISVPLLSTVDTVLMGQLSGLHLGAVGVGAMIFNFLYWNFGFLRMGTTGLTAQGFGRKSNHEMATVLGRALLTGLFLGIILILSQQLLWLASARAMQLSPEHYPLVKSYFLIRILAAPATLLLYSLMGWYFGMQNALYPLWITLFLNLVNIGLSMWLVMYAGWGVKGVAYGTLIAQYSGLLFAGMLLLVRYRPFVTWLSLRTILIWHEFLRFFSINKDIFIRTLCLSVVFFFVYSQASDAGEKTLAATVILLQFLNWMSYGIDGFAFAAESLCGKYFGGSNPSMLNRTIRFSMYWGASLGLAYSLFYGLGRDMLIRLFTSEKSVIQATLDQYNWIVWLPLIAFASYIWDGIFIGLTAVKAMRNSMFISFVVFFVLYYVLRNGTGPDALWIALLGFLLSRGVIQTGQYVKYGYTLK